MLRKCNIPEVSRHAPPAKVPLILETCTDKCVVFETLDRVAKTTTPEYFPRPRMPACSEICSTHAITRLDPTGTFLARNSGVRLSTGRNIYSVFISVAISESLRWLALSSE